MYSVLIAALTTINLQLTQQLTQNTLIAINLQP